MTRLFASPEISLDTVLARSAPAFGWGLLVERVARNCESPSASTSSSTMAVPFTLPTILAVTLMLLPASERDDKRLRLRETVRGGSSSSSSSSGEVVLRFLSEREPSKGSSSRMRLLKTECESGLMPPLAAGNKSRASLGTEDLRRAEISETSLSVSSGSRPFSTQSLHRQEETSITNQVSSIYALGLAGLLGDTTGWQRA